MAYEKRDLTWSLFKNDTKTRDTHSDYQGWVMIDGKEYWLNGWIKEGAKGKFISGTLKAKDGAAKAAEPAARPSLKDDMDGDSIPF